MAAECIVHQLISVTGKSLGLEQCGHTLLFPKSMLMVFEAMPGVQFLCRLIFGSGAELFRAALLRPARRAAMT